jgi:hypothetical protein
MKRIVFFLIPILLALLITPLSLYGCDPTTGTITPTTPPAGDDEYSQAQLASYLNTAINKHRSLNTYKYTMSSLTTSEIIGGSQAGTITVDSVTTGASNKAAEELLMSIQSTVGTSGAVNDAPLEWQNLVQEFYVLPDWLYIKVEVQNYGVQWGKTPLEDDKKKLYNLDNIDNQVDALQSPDRIEYLRSEKVDGVDCFVLAVTPNNDRLISWLKGQNTGSIEPDWDEVAQVAQGIKKLAYTCYITKDSHILARMVIEMEMAYLPEMIGAAAADFDTLSAEMAIDLKLYDFDKPWNITLPPEAASAIWLTDENAESFAPMQ